MHYALAILVAIIVFCGYLVVGMVIEEKRRKESLRERLEMDGSGSHYEEQPAAANINGDPSPEAMRMLTLVKAMGVDTEKSTKDLELRFANAGINSPDAPIKYMFYQRLLLLTFPLLALLLFMSAEPEDKLLYGFMSVFLLVIGLFGPKLYLKNMIDKRKHVLLRSFPDTLDLLLICVESGLALDAALSRVCNELGNAYPEMAGELNRTRLELALLNDRVRALSNLSARTDMAAFRSLVSTLIQSERFGTSLTDTLRVLSEEFRLQRLMVAEGKAARLPVLMTVPLIFLLMPALFIIVLAPAMVKISL